jgi:hypothetical protein
MKPLTATEMLRLANNVRAYLYGANTRMRIVVGADWIAVTTADVDADETRAATIEESADKLISYLESRIAEQERAATVDNF